MKIISSERLLYFAVFINVVEIRVITLSIIVLSFIVGISFYPQMPDKMASHWNIQGQVDGHLPKFWGLFLMPFLSVGLFLLFTAIPKIDPLKKNIKKFKKYFDMFVVLLISFLFYIYLLTVLWNSGIRFDMVRLLSPAFGVLYFWTGILTENAKRNWFIGIRTPWTLSSKKVWEKTHHLGGKLFKAAGIIAFAGAIFPTYGLYFILVPVILVVAFAIVYSYVLYQILQ